MKKIVYFILLMFCLICFSSCSGEPVPFSDKLFDGRDCYIDVTEITPQSYVNNGVFLYCQCKLADNNIIWMEIFPDEYVEYFDKEASAEDILFTARKVVYKETVRVNGKAEKIKNIFEDNNSKRIKIFRFQSVDGDSASKVDNMASTAVEFSEGLRDCTVVYTEVISIEPKYTTYSVSYSYPDSVICECKTVDDKSVWLYISIENYHEFLDDSASFQVDFINPSNAKKLDFVECVRLFGITANKTEKFSAFGQGADIPKQIVEFKIVDKEKVESSIIGNQAPVMYSGDQKVNQQIYVDITSITPQYVSYTNYTIPKYLICECETTEGTHVWISISIFDYEKDFFADYADSIGIKKDLNNKTRILGRILTTKEVAWDLESEINQNTIISYGQIAH